MGRVKNPTAEVTCPKCGTHMVVVPPTLGSFLEEGDDPEVVTPPTAPEGWELVYTDETGLFACPNPACDYEDEYDSVGSV